MKIIMLAGNGNSTRYIYNGLSSQIEIDHILITSPNSRKKLIKRRIKKLGVFHVLNQLFFQVFIIKILKRSSKQLIKQRIQELELNNAPLPENKTIDVGLVNSAKTIESLKKLNPDVVLVNGTAIIRKKVLEATNAVFINTHVGITPQYRGVHGGYWALKNQDQENFGVTVHKIDTGIDTGDIIYQDTCAVKMNDNFLTYPLYQTALAIPLLKKTFHDIEDNNLKAFKKDNAPSKLYYHPTFTGYIWSRIKYGVK